MKKERIKTYFDMYYNSELPAILERESEQELKIYKEKVIKHIKNKMSDSIENGSQLDVINVLESLCEEIENLK